MFSNFNTKHSEDTDSYSQLLNDLNVGNIESLVLLPKTRQLIVKYRNGNTNTVSIFPNDQTVVRLAASTNTPLTVAPTALRPNPQTSTANFIVISIFVLFFVYIFRSTIKIANNNLKFLGGKSKFIEPSSIDLRFDDIAGIPEALDEVKEIISFLKEPDSFSKLGAKIPKGFLIVGPPGTGKTLLAKAIAGEANVPFISTSASEFVELFVGLGANRVRTLFQLAKTRSPCIIFIDEIDSIGRQRGQGVGGGNDEREQTLNQLLTELDGFQTNSGVIVIAATNRPEILDSALTRPGRFDRKVYISLPDKKGRLSILSIHARTKPLARDVDLREIALKTTGFSGAELSNLLNEAAIRSARENKSLIYSKHLNQALEKTTFGDCSTRPLTFIQQKIIAYHELGKALLAYLIPETDDIDKITILTGSNRKSGFTSFLPREDYNDGVLTERKYLYSKLIVHLGGRAAEELVFGESEISQICSASIKEATLIASDMVSKYGFSQIGPISLNEGKQNSFASGFFGARSLYARKTNSEIDKEVLNLINSAYSIALKKLRPYIHILDEGSNILIDEETIDSKMFTNLLSKYKI